MYSWDTRVRFSETGPDGKLTMAGLLALFQDAGYQHAEDRGLGVSYTRAERKTYYLLSWNIAAYDMPPVGEQVRISTWFCRAAGPLAGKSLTMTGNDGRLLAVGNTRWVFMDLALGIPADPPAHLWGEEPLAPSVTLPPFPRRILMPGDATPGEPFPVSEADTDTNAHVNNVRFVALAARAAGIPGNLRGLSAEYRRQARVGDLLCPRTAATPDGTVVSLSSPDGEPYALFRFFR